jgi:5-methyltetrahydrofolate--homocysteine methyltransferase
LVILSDIAHQVMAGDIDRVSKLTEEAIKEKFSPQQIVQDGFVTALNLVGEKHSAGEVFLPEMLMAGMAVSNAMQLVRPLLKEADAVSQGTIVIGTVLGDVHDIGKNIVAMMCDGAGFQVIDLGVDVPGSRFIEAAVRQKADIIAMSALISTTRAQMAGIIREIRTSELDHKIKIMVGGAPLTPEFAASIGADGYAPDAGQALKKVKELLGIAPA